MQGVETARAGPEVSKQKSSEGGVQYLPLTINNGWVRGSCPDIKIRPWPSARALSCWVRALPHLSWVGGSPPGRHGTRWMASAHNPLWLFLFSCRRSLRSRQAGVPG
eukprot:gene20326-biopygen17573